MSPQPFFSRLLALLFLAFSYSAVAQVDSLELFIQETMEEHHIPGFAAAVINKDGICWEGYFGTANFDEERLVDTSTIFYLASVSKPVTSAALMKLYEQDSFELDDDINKYLPFEVRNAYFPDDTITFRQLLNHESSIRDYWSILSPMRVAGDSPIPLDTFLFNYLNPDGSYYFYSNFTGAYPPGSYYEYSNIGYALIGLLVEEISGTPFNEYCYANLFDEMEMFNSHWFLAETDTSKLAMSYENTPPYDAIGHIGRPWYPATQLRSTARDLTHFLLTFIHNGKFGGNTVFDSSTIQLITPYDVDGDYFGWFIGDTGGYQFWAHGGGVSGANSGIAFNPQDSIGIVFLMNSSPDILAETAIELIDFARSDYCLEVSTTEINNQTWVEVFPNPSTGIFYIEASANDPLEITVYDAMGQVVMPSHPLVNGQIDLSALPNGLYFLEVHNREQSVVKRIVKQ